MYTQGNNGIQDQLAQYETPFTDDPPHPAHGKEAEEPAYDSLAEKFFTELESPFRSTFEEAEAGQETSPLAEEYVQLLAELEDQEFDTVLYEMASELEDRWSSKVSNETAMGGQFQPFVYQQAEAYFSPIYQEHEALFDSLTQRFSGNPLASYTENEVDQIFESLLFSNNQLSPVQEQFFGKIFNKVKSVVKKGVQLAKKGISAVGKLLPINLILGKLKALIRPLLKRVLRFAINKLPANLRGHARKLAKRFLKLETPENDPFNREAAETADLGSIQEEYNNLLAHLVFSPEENEAERVAMEYEQALDSLEQEEAYLADQVPSLDEAREKFIQELSDLPEGSDPTPAIERFLPAAILALKPVIKMGINIIGRKRVINFLAGLLARLVRKYIPSSVAKPLAVKIIDTGMGLIGFETMERNSPQLAYEAIANAIQDTMLEVGELSEEELDDQETLSVRMLEAFETAAANNFPASYIREELRRSQQDGVWLMMPRHGSRPLYKKYSKIFDISLSPQASSSVHTFRGLPLSSFLRDQLSLNIKKPVKARVHLYEAIPGTWLSKISKSEKVSGLNSGLKAAWSQLHPLTPQAASLLLKEPGLGKGVSSRFLNSRHLIGIGQRFYFLEIPGARSIPPAPKQDPGKGKVIAPPPPKHARPSDIQGVINFPRAEIRFNYFFSEEEARSVAEKLNRNDYLGAALSIRRSVRDVLNGILIRNVGSKVKLVHEALPEQYLDEIEDPQEQWLGTAGRALGGLAINAAKDAIKAVIQKLIVKLSEMAYKAVVNYFKARKAEFIQEQASAQDGVTIKIIWSNIPGMSTIAAAINALRGKLSIGNLRDIALPSIPTPDVVMKAGKNFD